MYLLSPIGYPIACLLDHLLGSYHNRTFSRDGLKTLLMLHEAPPHVTDRLLHPLEVSTASSVLSISTVPVSGIMTPFKRVFVLSADTYLNEKTRFEILRSGVSKIPVWEGTEECSSYYAVLDVRFLVGGAGFDEQSARVGDVALETLMHIAPETSLAEAVGIFRYRGAKMVIVTEGGGREGRALGILTFRDVMEAAIGGEMGMRPISVSGGYGSCIVA